MSKINNKTVLENMNRLWQFGLLKEKKVSRLLKRAFGNKEFKNIAFGSRTTAGHLIGATLENGTADLHALSRLIKIGERAEVLRNTHINLQTELGNWPDGEYSPQRHNSCAYADIEFQQLHFLDMCKRLASRQLRAELRAS